MRFEQFYVNAPICSPSRAASLTGQYPQRWRITLLPRQPAAERGARHGPWLDPAAPTLPRALQHAGYATGHFGKWHLGGQRDVGDAPLITAYGFDASLTNFEGLGPRVLPLLDPFDGTAPAKLRPGLRHLGAATSPGGPLADHQPLRRRDRVHHGGRGGRRPFYVNLWPDDVHSPFFPPEARRGDGSKRALYLGVLKAMDEQLGALFDHSASDGCATTR